MKEKRKILKVLIILFAILIISVICLNVVKSQNVKNSRQYETMGVDISKTDIEDKKNLQYKNIEALMNINGELPVGTITKKFAIFYEENLAIIFRDTINLSTKELQEYYQKNSSKIELLRIIDTEESFINLTEKLREIDCNFSQDYDVCEFKFIENGIIRVICSFTNGKILEGELLYINVDNMRMNY